MRRSLLAVVVGYLLASVALVTAQGTGWRIRQGSTEIFVGTVARPQTDGTDFGTTAFRWDIFAGTLNIDDVLTSTSYFAAPVGTDCTAATVGFSYTGDTDTGWTATAANTLVACVGGTARLTGTTATWTSTLPLLSPAGTAAAPSITTSGDTDTGLYWRTTDVLSFTMGGGSTPDVEFDAGRITMQANGRFSWSNTAGDASATEDLLLFRDAAGRLTQRNGTNAQTQQWAETFTDGSNYELGEIVMGSNTMTIRTGTAGTGVDNLDIALTASGTGAVKATGRFAYSTRETVTVDAATTFAVTSTYVLLQCTGAETINTITGGTNGMVLVLENSDPDCTLADDDDVTAANAIDLTGTATNDVGAVKKVIVLHYNGAEWFQMSESDN